MLRGKGASRFITKNLLEHLYWKKRLSLPQIGKMLKRANCTVFWYFKKYGISRRTRLETTLKHQKLNKQLLITLYWKKKLSLPKIAHKLDVPYSALYYYFQKFKIPRRSRLEATLKKPDLTPTTTLSYILGVILGDGTTSIYRSKQHPSSTYYIIDLAVKSQIFANSFGEALRKIGLHPCFCLKRSRYNEKPYLCYRVMSQSKVFVQWIRNLTLEEIENQILLNNENKKAFVRGMYESEGYYGKKELSISNTDLSLVSLLSKCLDSLGFISSKHVSQIPSGNFHVLRILGGRAERLRFVRLIEPCIKGGN